MCSTHSTVWHASSACRGWSQDASGSGLTHRLTIAVPNLTAELVHGHQARVRLSTALQWRKPDWSTYVLSKSKTLACFWIFFE